MPQPGLHAVLALATRKIFPHRPWFPLGLVLGSVIPDLYGYAQAVAVSVAKMDPIRAEANFHRTATHSLLFALFLGIVFWLLSLAKKSKEIASFGFGLATGMAVLHTLPDLFAWFDGVAVLWPFLTVNLWSSVHLSETVENLLRAGNFFAFGFYFCYLNSLAKKAGTSTNYLQRLRINTWVQFALGTIFAVLAMFLSTKTYSLLDGAVLLLFAFPNALWVTWCSRDTIEAI